MACHLGGPGSPSGQSLWNVRWIKWHWNRFLSNYFDLDLSVSFHKCTVLTHSFIHMPLMLYYLSNYKCCQITNTHIHIYTHKCLPGYVHPEVYTVEQKTLSALSASFETWWAAADSNKKTMKQQSLLWLQYPHPLCAWGPCVQPWKNNLKFSNTVWYYLLSFISS